MISLEAFRRHMTVPYVPTIGPVHPDCVTQQLLDDIERVSFTDEFLPYDKDARWYQKKSEKLIRGRIVETEAGLCIPTFNQSASQLKLYLYGDQMAGTNFEANAAELMAAQKPRTCTLITFADNRPAHRSDSHTTAVYLDTFNEYRNQGDYQLFKSLTTKQQHSLPLLASEPGDSGFHFLFSQIIAGQIDSDILVRLRSGAIAGAIGPLMTARDVLGRTFLLPPYFGVAKDLRRQNYGSLLWSDLRHYACDRGIDYVVVQANIDQKVDAFYDRQGLRCFGYVTRRTLPGSSVIR